jgi:glycerol uptake facilitator-like aquaporin
MTLARRLLAEALGTGLLTAAVVGSGIMAEQLADGNDALALLANTAATVAALALLIALFSAISGAHFNPIVSVALALVRRDSWSETSAYVAVQVMAAMTGTVLAHAMFGLPLVDSSTHARTGPALWLSESVATFGLLLVVLGHRRAQDAPWMVAAWIGAAYWFTASTSFANPAVAIARSLTDTFSGIRPADVPAFVIAELVGALVAVALCRALFADNGAAAATR